MQPEVGEEVSWREKQSFAYNCWVLDDDIAFPQKISSQEVQNKD